MGSRRRLRWNGSDRGRFGGGKPTSLHLHQLYLNRQVTTAIRMDSPGAASQTTRYWVTSVSCQESRYLSLIHI